MDESYEALPSLPLIGSHNFQRLAGIYLALTFWPINVATSAILLPPTQSIHRPRPGWRKHLSFFILDEVLIGGISLFYFIALPGITFDRFVRACVVVNQLHEAFTRLETNRDGWIQIGYENLWRRCWRCRREPASAFHQRWDGSPGPHCTIE
ncbi:hypothetical protein C8R44DRAFT_725623 [Mycena epipterygia]|nr:hypothetical protein C8R44DRAFT_725623 [Mycena epipterygia]